MLNLHSYLARGHSSKFEPCDALHRNSARCSATDFAGRFPHRPSSTDARNDGRLSNIWTDPPARPRPCQTETIWIALHQTGEPPGRFRAGDKILCDFIPRNIEVNIAKIWVAQGPSISAKYSFGGATKRPKHMCAQIIVVPACRFED